MSKNTNELANATLLFPSIKKTVERDERKKELSEQNCVKLFIIDENGDVESLIKMIREYRYSKK
jgi:hypothetical protein